ncbi:hypothetical protein SLE2022_355530 [Rubroshorea leprosula]
MQKPDGKKGHSRKNPPQACTALLQIPKLLKPVNPKRSTMSRSMSAAARSTPSTSSSSSSSVITTVTVENTPTATHPPETLVLQLRPRKKKVTWKEGTVDNEFMNKKSSKKCCIFHKQKPFDEDDSDDDDDHHSHRSCGHDRKDDCGPSTSSGN